MSSSVEQQTTAPEAPGRARVAAASLMPGVAVAAVATAVAMGVGRLLPTVSPLLIAIVLGAVAANTVQLPATIRPGLTFSSKKLLRVGIALLGLQLMLSDIVGLGWGMIAVVVAIVTLGITGTMMMGSVLGLPWTQRLLIACGFSICGAAATAAVDGVVDAKEEEVLTAVALVVLFGTLMIPTIPLLSRALGMDETTAGMWAGGSIHEVAQVIAAGGAIGGGALAVAAVVKLARVVMLAPVMAVIGLQQRRRSDGTTAGTRPPLVPLFVVAFLACAALRSTGVLPDGVLSVAKVVQTALLTAAMFALGTGVHIATIRKVGPRPLALAAMSTVWVAAIALVGVLIVN
ncbi:YeiH family protein [Prescottella equi]|uniref:YeiH family protein n=1 Tax=Rhodococcus hoagii TaxID=43767 RepID=UPI001C7513CA|nr:putative sulfate exporter family transporter [Prescottella equi]BCN79913.1 membrane protein [Prescottella equi]